MKTLARPHPRFLLAGAAVMISLGAASYVLLSTSGDSDAERNPDPRAAKGADPGISFERAAGDLRLHLPAAITQVRYLARNDSEPYFLRFSFITSCSAVPRFATDNDLVRGRAEKADVIELEGLRKTARDLGSPMPEGAAATVWGDGDENGLKKRAVANVPVKNQDCQVVGTFEDYS
ncbi:hypothetical protein [Actinomadura rubrisoli]|uniref:Uncharacterized protein n=1 Tax=Actinomadura rubrisoli TaxID=2530368 RepID=A0A4V2YUZ0_9ACTN|nr:hypothetical protein [Actinomadura rubrisoli]TDD79167.1 hypothetical protein E1298_28385 [Actinomadura rubrisoli]